MDIADAATKCHTLKSFNNKIIIKIISWKCIVMVSVELQKYYCLEKSSSFQFAHISSHVNAIYVWKKPVKFNLKSIYSIITYKEECQVFILELSANLLDMLWP